ncbi:hypothetical protein WJX72_010471 [[Myrmecia] bisecta]|uniref:DUF1206 domain-containing protein n=1 Tax=[Myrmecia] bisecta TaxID=41462 RepID=A0AAW1R9G2_9CHLO
MLSAPCEPGAGSQPLLWLQVTVDAASLTAHNGLRRAWRCMSSPLAGGDVEAQHPLPPASLNPPHDFNHPRGVKRKHRRALRILGKFGWVFKGIVYAIIGGMACKSAVGDRNGNSNESVSPQGAFILVGSNQIGIPLLVVLAVGLATYSTWRYWEAITGQGADAEFSNFQNFFRYRLSPFVSGVVYTAYMVYVISLCFTKRDELEGKVHNQTFPGSWQHSNIGKLGLAICGLAFVIATITQLKQAFWGQYHSDLREDMPSWLRWFTYVTGFIGILARGAVFLFTAILFFRQIGNAVGDGKTVVGDALESMRDSPGGQVGLFILGLGLIIYGGFAVLMAYVRIFPSPPPSRIAKIWGYRDGEDGNNHMTAECREKGRIKIQGNQNHGVKALDDTDDRDSPAYRQAHPSAAHTFFEPYLQPYRQAHDQKAGDTTTTTQVQPMGSALGQANGNGQPHLEAHDERDSVTEVQMQPMSAALGQANRQH